MPDEGFKRGDLVATDDGLVVLVSHCDIDEMRGTIMIGNDAYRGDEGRHGKHWDRSCFKKLPAGTRLTITV